MGILRWRFRVLRRVSVLRRHRWWQWVRSKCWVRRILVSRVEIMMTEKSQSSSLLPSSGRAGARPWWFLRLFGAGGMISKWSFSLTDRLGSTVFGETFCMMSSPTGKHDCLKVIGLAAGTKLYLMLDGGSYFLFREHLAKVETCKVNWMPQ